MGLREWLFGKKVEAKPAEQEKPNEIKIAPRLRVDYGHPMYKHDVGKKFYRPFPKDAPKERMPVFRHLFEDVYLGFAIDFGNQFLLLTIEHLESNPGFTVDDFEQGAMKHLTEELAISNWGEIAEPDGLKMIVSGGNYEAVMILLESFWLEMEPELGDEILFAIPSADVLLLCSRSNSAAKSNMAKFIRHRFETHDDSALLLSKGIYLKRKGRKEIVIYDRVE